MRINVVCVGKIKEKFYTQAVEEYSKRLSRYCKLDIVELPDEKTPDNASDIVNEQIKNKEVLFLYDTEQVDLMKSIREYYSSNFSDIKLYEEIVTEGNIDGLRNILKKYKQDDMVINLTGGKRINSLILLSLCKRRCRILRK